MFDPQKTLIAVVAGVAFLATAGLASAATITNVEYSNGDVTIQGNAGQSVSGKVRVVVPNNQEVEFVEFDVISDSLAPVCVDTGRLQEGTHWISIPGDVKFPPNTGTYSLNVTTHGIFGGLAADDCEGDQNGSNSFGSSVRTVGGTTGTTVGGDTFASLQAMIQSLMAQVACLTTGGAWDGVAKSCVAKPAPAKPAGCSGVVAYTGWNASAAQASLLAVEAGRAVFNAAGVYAPTGFYGPISQNAASAVAAACK